MARHESTAGRGVPPRTVLDRAMLREPDFWTGLLLAALGAGLLALASSIRLTEAGLIGPRFVPQVVAVLLILGGLVLSLRPQPLEDRGGSRLPLAALAVPALGFLCVAAVPLVGYLAATWPTATVALVLFGMRRPLRAVLTGLALTLTMHLLFVELMGLFMPRGRFFDLMNLLG